MSEKRHTVLIVDDQVANLQVLDEVLSSDYTVKAALNGQQALTLVDRDRPDLILLDVMMPDMDGLTVCRRIKANPEFKALPIIFVTARGQAHDEEAGFAVGAEDYITKPIVPAVVRARVRTHLELYDRKRNLESLVELRTAELRAEYEQRAHATDSLAAAYDLLSAVMENFGGAIASADQNGLVTFANQQLTEFAGVPQEEILGFQLGQLFPDAEVSRAVRSALENRERRAFEISVKSSSGGEMLLGVKISPLLKADVCKGVVMAAQDITDRRSMEHQLLQASKMATLGEMATGIAHEINQPLNVIRMAAQMLGESMEEGELDADFILERSTKIIRMVDRASRIINHLRTFGRRTGQGFQKVAANQPIYESLELMEEKLRLHSVQLNLDLADGLPEVHGDSANLEQVFINLMLNAVDAFEEAGTPPDQRRMKISSHPENSESAISYEIADSGPGIPDHIQEKLFDPFFTTKEVGKGTGLGLSISYGIIQAHGGRIFVRANRPSGAIFCIRLPVQQEAS